jgi:methionyl-tRNA formyltransferase
MTKENLRIIFMGTPEFAVPSLEILIENNFNVVAVITAPDKPRGRGQQLAAPPVKEAALAHQVPVLQPTNLKSPEFIEELKSYQADLQVVVAFRMLPEVVWDMPTIGTFNLHASLLPQYRGAAPINWAIINGETETGVTTFMIRHEIDTGSILFQEKEPIHPEDTAGTLYERLMQKGAWLVLKTVKAISRDDYTLIPQKTEGIELKSAPKIHKETCEINWHQSAGKVRDFIRGLSPYPAAFTALSTPQGDKNCKIFKTSLTDMRNEMLKPGAIKTDNKTYLYIQTADELLAIEELQLEGKKRMPVQEFLKGNKL